MTAIGVCGILSDGGRVLLVRSAAGVWDLPGGILRDEDESIEAALVRALDEELGVTAEDQEFLDTYYVAEPGETRPALCNVSIVRSWSGFPHGAAAADGMWVAFEEVPALAIEETALRALRDGLGLDAAQALLPGAPIIIVTGPRGAAKSTVSKALCRRLERSACVSADELRHLVISGYASPVPGRANPVAAAEQNSLMLANLAMLVRNFSLAGFQTVVDTTIETAEELDCCLEPFAGLARVHVVTLLPSPEALRLRDEGRAAELRMGERGQELHRVIAANGETRGLRLDGSARTVEETVDHILAHLNDARVL